MRQSRSIALGVLVARPDPARPDSAVLDAKAGDTGFQSAPGAGAQVGSCHLGWEMLCCIHFKPMRPKLTPRQLARLLRHVVANFTPHLVAAQGSTEAQLLAFYGELNRWDLRFTAAYFDHSGLYAYDQ